MKKMFFTKKLFVSILLMILSLSGTVWAQSTNFTSFSVGSVHYQGTGGTTVTGAGYTIPSPYGSLWTLADEWGFQKAPYATPLAFDQEVKDDGTGNKVWRLSNAVTSGSYSFQPNSPSSPLPAGETTAALYNDRGPNHTTPISNPPLPRAFAATKYFHGGFKFKSATGAPQTGLAINVNAAPRQTSYRMTQIGISDAGTGFNLTFIETTPISFPTTTIATNLSYNSWHQLDIYIEFVDGAANDIVTVLLNGAVIYTGTTWETYYASLALPSPRPIAVDALLFRAAGTAAPGTLGNGLYFDDVVYNNAPLPPATVRVYSDPAETTLLSSHYTIQAGIDAAVDGNVVRVNAGTYTENININKAIFLRGPNTGIAGNAARVAEAVLLNCYIDINNAGTTVLDGLHINRTDGALGAYPMAPADQILLDGAGTNTVQNCIIERWGSVAGTVIRGITTTAGGGTKNILNNKITGDPISLFSGHKSWNNAIYINGGTAAVNISGNTVMNSRTALSIDDYTVNVVTSGNTFNNNGTHIGLGGTVPTAGQFVMGANDFINNIASTMVNCSNVNTNFRLDITSSTLNGAAFNTLTNAQLFEVEARMAHKTTGSKKGKVTYVANTQYVNNFVGKTDLIQNSVLYAEVGNIINLQAGTYPQRVVIDKSVTLQGVESTRSLYILDGTGLAPNGSGPGSQSGIVINGGVTNTTIKDLTVQNFTGVSGNNDGGIYGVLSNNNLTITNVALLNNPGASGFYANGPVDNVSITNSSLINNGGGARGMVIWNGLKTNINFSNNVLSNNSCCGIELQDGNASGVTVNGNTIDIGGGDNAIGLTGLNNSIGSNTINGNIITGGGRFGIEIKNPAGGVTVNANAVTLSSQNSDLRDRAGIAILRRAVTPGNVDVPNGVTVTGNTVTGYQQASASEGFGIVVEGTNHVVTGNTVTGCDVGILQQQNPSNYPGDADQSNLADLYFGRGNSPMTCGNTITGNTLSNTMNTRNIGVGGGIVTNTTSLKTFCSIQAAIDDAQTLTGHTITVSAGTYNENININKTINLRGAQAGNCAPGRTGAESVISCPNGIGVNASDVTINGFTIRDQDGANSALAPGFGYAVFMAPPNTGTQLMNNIFTNNTMGTGLSNTGATPAQVNISCNWYDANVTPGTSFSGAIIALESAVGKVSNVLIDNNKFSNHSNGVGISFENPLNPANAATGITMTGNVFDANLRAVTLYNLLSSSFSNNEVSNSTFATSGDLRIFGGVQNLAVTNNKFDGSNGVISAIRITAGSGPNSNITVFENSFTGYTNANPVYATTYVAPGGVSPATCNWYGTANNAAIASIIGAPVVYAPYLVNGTDNSPATGFQPVPGSCAGGVPKLSTTINSVTVNANNDGNDDLGSFTVCNSTNNILFNSFTDQNGLTNPNLRVYQTFTASNVTVPFCNNCSATMAAFAGATGSAALINPALPGTLTMRFRSWIDANTNGNVDPSELASDWIQYTITVNGYPALQSTLNSITLTNNRDGNDETATLVVCNTADNLHFTGIIDVQGVTPAASVKVKQETIRTNITFNGAADGVYPIGSFPPDFYRTVALINPAMSGTLVIRRTIFFDINNNNNLDANECANDGVVYTVHVDGEAPVLTVPANQTVNCANIPLVGSATAIDALDPNPAVVYLGETFTGGSCPGNYTLTRTWSATDDCGNATTASQTITVVDNTPPTLTVPANVTLQCSDPLPQMPLKINSSPNTIAGTYNVGTALFGAPLSSTPLTANAVMVIDDAGNPFDACENITNGPALSGKIAVIERGGCTPPAGYFVTKANKAQLAGAIGVIFIFDQPGDHVVTMGLPPGPNPTITIPLMLVSKNYGNSLKNEILSGPVNVSLSVPTVIANDACSFTAITHQQTITPGSCPSNYTILNTWTATDQCGNAATASQTITVVDNTPPTIVCPGPQTKTTNPGSCYYTAMGGEFNPTSASDNCGAVTISNNFNNTNTLAGAQFPIGTTNVVWTATDPCGNQATCAFDVTVTDDQNATNYIIYAEKDVEFGEYNYIGGDVGVTAPNGKAKFKKNSVLDPFTIRSKNIDVDLPSSVNNRVYSPATGGPTPPFTAYSGNTAGLSNIEVTYNRTLNGNWKDVKVKKGITCTLTGSNFGKITIEEGANVTFTAAMINLEKMDVHNGKKQNNILTVVNFSNPTSVMVKDKVEVGDDCRVNVGGPKVTFYMGDNSGGEEKFEVKGENTQVTANIMIPNGKLHVHGGKDINRPTIMTGWYIIEKLDSHEKYVYWNKYDCGTNNFSFVQQSTQPEVKPEVPAVVTIPVIQPADEFRVNVYPNPSAYDFSIQVSSKSNEPVTVRILDMNGKVLSVHAQQTKANNIRVGDKLTGGTYIAEVIQGTNRKTLKLVKLN